MSDLDRIKAKVAKLLSLGENGAAAENEAETAMRQAESLMRKYGIERSQIVADGGEVSYTWESGYYAFGDGKANKKVPVWYQWLTVSIARFTDTIVRMEYRFDEGMGVRFQGEAEDIVLALWFADYLKDSIRRATRDAKMGSSQGREAFRKAMAIRLCYRMNELREKRNQEFSSSTALVVVNDKLAKRDAFFGGESYRANKKAVTISNAEAIRKGYSAADRVQFNKPLSGQEAYTQVH